MKTFKKLLISAVVGALAISGPAGAAGGRPKPYKSESVTIQFATGLPPITPAEFLATCDIPTTTQGLDAYVFAVPRPYRNIQAEITTQNKGADLMGAPEHHDIDIYIYDSSCKQIVEFSTEALDEEGYLPPGSAFILLVNYAMPVSGPAEVSFRLEPLKGF